MTPNKVFKVKYEGKSSQKQPVIPYSRGLIRIAAEKWETNREADFFFLPDKVMVHVELGLWVRFITKCENMRICGKWIACFALRTKTLA